MKNLLAHTDIGVTDREESRFYEKSLGIRPAGGKDAPGDGVFPNLIRLRNKEGSCELAR